MDSLRNGDASRAAFASARWLRDRQIELPVGMFQFVPDPEGVSGTIVAPSISQSDSAVRDVRMELVRGRMTKVTAASGADWVRRRAQDIGPDGDVIALVNMNTNPLSPPQGIGIDIGANWENGATNRATRMWRMSVRLRDANFAAGDRALMRDGRLLWDGL